MDMVAGGGVDQATNEDVEEGSFNFLDDEALQEHQREDRNALDSLNKPLVEVALRTSLVVENVFFLFLIFLHVKIFVCIKYVKLINYYEAWRYNKGYMMYVNKYI